MASGRRRRLYCGVIEFSPLAAFLAGLLGGGHCAGMCGGIVTALTLQPGQPAHRRDFWPTQLAYNLSRIVTYTLLGALAGLLGSVLLLFDTLLPIGRVLYTIANLMLIALGLYLAGFWYGLRAIENAGARLWAHVQPKFARLLPILTLRQAAGAGLLWGLLPCGLVYSVLTMAFASGDAVRGGWVMLAFGLGTLPNLLAFGLVAARLKGLLQRTWLRRLMGLGVVALGFVGLGRVL